LAAGLGLLAALGCGAALPSAGCRSRSQVRGDPPIRAVVSMLPGAFRGLLGRVSTGYCAVSGKIKSAPPTASGG
ncbi:MAG: hypothetical protein WAO04_19435, partial [Candidatus Sulfotelmatobacter sp.]